LKSASNEINIRDVVIVSTTPGYGHGAEEVLVQLMRACCKLKQANPVIHIVAPDNSRVLKTANKLGYKSTVLKSTRDSMLHNIPAAMAAVRSCPKKAVVHGWGLRSMEAAFVIAKCIKSESLVCTFHDSPFSTFHGLLRRLTTRILHVILLLMKEALPILH